jgi:hypothetical protein
MKWFTIVLILLGVSGCGIWEDITGTSNTSVVTLKGEVGSNCTFSSECRSNMCVYPGICQ